MEDITFSYTIKGRKISVVLDKSLGLDNEKIYATVGLTEIKIQQGKEKIREVILEEGEEIKVKAEKGNTEQYRIMVCYQNCILSKSEADALKG